MAWGLAVIGLGGVVGAIFFWPAEQRDSIGDGAHTQTVAPGDCGDCWRFRAVPRTLAIAFALSLLLQFNVIVHFVLIAQALDRMPARDFCLIVPLVSFVIMLPISINGIGLRENALAVMLGYYGVGAAERGGVGRLVHIANLILSLAGPDHASRQGRAFGPAHGQPRLEGWRGEEWLFPQHGHRFSENRAL